jgi:murein L,D-transpeptidase YcbB/YkuD
VRRTAEENPDGSIYYVNAAFRDYPTFKASVEDHFAFLRANSRYAAAGVFSAPTDREYFEALKRAGYATDVNYADKLMRMVESVRMFSASMHQSETAPALENLPPPSRLLLIGLQGADVARLQTALAERHFYFSPIDGNFGPATFDAVKAFQKSAALDVDGIAGAATKTALGLGS